MSELKIIPARGIALQVLWHDKNINQSKMLNKNPIKPTDKFIPIEGKGGVLEMLNEMLMECRDAGVQFRSPGDMWVKYNWVVDLHNQIKSQLTADKEGE